EAEHFARCFRAMTVPFPDLALLVPVAAEQDRLPLVAMCDQCDDALGLGESAEIEEVAVESERVLAVSIAQPLGCGGLDRDTTAARGHRIQDAAAPRAKDLEAHG